MAKPQPSRQHCHRNSYRNEVIHLKTLLRSACQRLDMYGIDLPVHLERWWASRRRKQEPIPPTFAVIAKRVRLLLDRWDSELDRHDD